MDRLSGRTARGAVTDTGAASDGPFGGALAVGPTLAPTFCLASTTTTLSLTLTTNALALALAAALVLPDAAPTDAGRSTN